MGKFSDVRLRALLQKRPVIALILNDGHVAGLSIRIGPKSATWYLRLRVAGEGGVGPTGKQRVGKQHRVCLGDYPVVTLEAAQSLANQYLDQAKWGQSPVEALAAAASADGATVAKLGAGFLADCVLMKDSKPHGNIKWPSRSVSTRTLARFWPTG
jgi:hypothetical protein